MNLIETSIYVYRNKKDFDESQINKALMVLQIRKTYLTPLFKECNDKGISMQDICPELNKEWNDIILTLSNHYLEPI